MKLPLIVNLELIERVEDKWFYELVVTVPGTDASTTTAFMESNINGEAKIVRLERNGFASLREDVRDELLIRLFRLAYGEMIEADGAAIDWAISDASSFVRKQFTSADAGAILSSLIRFVGDKIVVRDVSVVRIE